MFKSIVRFALSIAVLGVSGLVLFRFGVYGITLFIGLPIALGAASVWSFRPATKLRACALSTVTLLAALLGLFAIGLEGAICLLMCFPLSASMAIAGGMVVYNLRETRAARLHAFLLLLPIASLTWDVKVPPTIFQVSSELEIAAAPETVWHNVISFSQLPEPEEWFFRAGVAYPIRARIEGAGPGAIRYCEFSTGPFVEPIETWDEPNLLRFKVTANPAPLNEWSPYANLAPKHLHGYLVSKQGQFQLTRLPGNRTLLVGTTWYQHGLWPGDYWRWWSDAIIHRIHLRVLNHIRTLSEAQ